MRHLLTLAVFMFLTTDGHSRVQATFYVSPDGSDSSTGTFELPFATLVKARNVIRTINDNMTGDILVYLRVGTYELTSTFTLLSVDGGTNGYHIIYQAYNCENPAISGGMRVRSWVLHDASKNIYKATIDKSIDSRQLYVNGTRAVRARSMDASGWSEKGDGYDCPTDVYAWKNIKNVEVVSYQYWKCHRGPIEFMSDPTHAVMSQPYWENLHVQANAPPAWIENAYELLDSPGEWYLDRADGVLYYEPRAGEDMNSVEIVLPILETLLSGSQVSNIQFKGITFEHATWNIPNSTLGFPCLQAEAIHAGINWEFTQVPGNIVFDHSTDIKFEGNKFQHFGITSLQFYVGCKNNHIYNNIFNDISGSAISIGGLTDPTPAIDDLVKDNVVDNNLIRNVALEYKGCVGIFIGYTEHTTVVHNEIYNLPYSGISAGWDWSNQTVAGRDNEIGFNHIDSVMMVLNDGGAIYTLSSQPGTVVHENYINHQFHEYGAIYPDEGSSDMHWHHNVIRNVPVWLFMWTSSIENIRVDFNYYDNQNQTTNGVNCVIQNNVFVSEDSWPAEAEAIMKNARRGSITNEITGLSVTAESSILYPNDLLQLALNLPSCSSNVRNATWISSNIEVATVSTNGLVTAKSMGSAVIVVKAEDGSIIDSLKISVNGPTSTSRSPIEPIFIYPNPVTTSLNIKNLTSSSATVVISDMLGRTMENRQVSFGELLDVSDLPKGIYIIKIIDSDNLLTSRLVKE